MMNDDVRMIIVIQESLTCTTMHDGMMRKSHESGRFATRKKLLDEKECSNLLVGLVASLS